MEDDIIIMKGEVSQHHSTPPLLHCSSISDSKAIVPILDHPIKNELAVGDPTSPCSIELCLLEGQQSLERDVVFLKLNHEKNMTIIRAWEDNAKDQSINRYGRKLVDIFSMETAKKAIAEAKLKKIEDALERRKASLVEKMKNEIAYVHKKAEVNRAVVRARHGKKMLEVEERALKYRRSGKVPPTKFTLCFCF